METETTTPPVADAAPATPVSPVADAAKKKTLDFMERLKPGEGNPEGCSPADVRPCGKADGVIYFDNIEIYDNELRGMKVLRPGKERQALRYLMGPAALADENDAPTIKRISQAVDWCMMHPGSIGICEPVYDFLLHRHPEIEKEADELNHPLNRKFLSSKAGINANQPEHVKRWNVVNAEDGIWCVFYV